MSVYDRVMELLKDMPPPTPTVDPFTGLLQDRNGVKRVLAGKVMPVQELNPMQWVAPGGVGPMGNEPQ